MRECDHKNIRGKYALKRNYTHGYRSRPKLFCKKCGVFISRCSIKGELSRKKRSFR